MQSGRSTRQLAVILHADVVSSTELVRRNEALAHERIQDAFRRLSAVIHSYGGVTHELRGDALLAEFPRASDAVSAALAFQAANASHNERLDENIRPYIRAGISLGEVIIADHTLTGPDVVLAQRLEQLAAPGGVCISQAAYQSIPRRLPFDFHDLGDQTVKGFDEPVRAYSVALRPGAVVPAVEDRERTERGPRPRTLPLPTSLDRRPRRFAVPKRLMYPLTGLALAATLVVAALVARDASPPAATASDWSQRAPALSIVVLPFVNASDDSNTDAFAEAVTEDLITDLSRIAGSFVIASNSTFSYRGRQVDPRQVAEELGVHYVLTGSVRRNGEEIRVTVALIDGESGAQIWGDRFERTRGTMFGLQEEVTGRLARALNLELKGAISRKAKLRAPADLDAEDYAVRAWAEIWNRPQSPATNKAGLELAAKALSLDPENTQALSTAGYAHFRASSSRWSDDPAASLRLGLEMAEKAVALDPGDADSQYVLSYGLRLAGDRIRGEEANRLCVELNPNHAPGHGGLGIFSLQDGRLDDAKRHFEQAIALSPHDPLRAIWYNFLASIELISDHPERAVEIASRALAANADYMGTSLTLAAALHRLGRTEEAAAVLARVREAQPKLLSVAVATKRIFQAASPRAEQYKEKYMRVLSAAGVPD